MTALMRSSNWPRYLVPDSNHQHARSSVITRFSRKNFGHIATGNFLSKTLDNRRFSDARFAKENRVVLRAAAKDLDDALDFVLTSDDGVHLAFSRDFRKVVVRKLSRQEF